MDFFRPKRAGRKYVDIIHKAGGIWANWQPSISIQAGHYGLIDKETGEFQRQGNIFHDPELAAIVSKYLPLTVCPAVDIYVLRSFDARNVDISPEAHVNVFGAAELTFGGQWKFGRARGAVLVLHRLQITSLPGELLTELKEAGWGNGKHLVTQSYACPGYALYLSNKKRETLTISLRADGPAVPGVAAGAGTQAGWTANGACGVYQQAYADEALYVPLYQIQQIEKDGDNRRQVLGEIDGDGVEWSPVEVPWKFLDDEGEELPDLLEDDTDSDLE